MKSANFILLMPALVCVVCAEPATVIPSIKARAATLEFAHKLTDVGKTEEASPRPPETAPRNPFNMEGAPPVGGGGAAPVPAVPVEVSTRGKLEAIAPQITPTGTVEIGGGPILLFGKKKLKVGDRLPIVFEGQPYELEISDIQRTSFTLRLGGEEITRPIKSAIKPKS